MKILFLHSGIPNYVTDGLFHGLHSLGGVSVTDVPRVDYMYTDAAPHDLAKTGSRGATLYGLLQEDKGIKGTRTFWQAEAGAYDYIIFTDIQFQCESYHALYFSLPRSERHRICIVDGNDTTRMFPYHGFYFNTFIRPWTHLIRPLKSPYFKREFESAASLRGFQAARFPWTDRILSKMTGVPHNLLPISMSIPEQHIEEIPFGKKTLDFVPYNVDSELKNLFPAQVAELGKWQPAFASESAYFDSIRAARFGITTKRAGWDCLRHYEYAAKGAILCFKDLFQKSARCAPFGLNASNCIPYTTEDYLEHHLKGKSLWELEQIQEAQYAWVRTYTTKKVASRFLDQLEHVSIKNKAKKRHQLQLVSR